MKHNLRDIVHKDTKDFILVEPFIDPQHFLKDGFLRAALTNAELMKFVAAKPTSIYPIAVAEFYGNLNKETRRTTITTRKQEEGRIVEEEATIDLLEAARVLGLRNDGETVESACSDDFNTELRRYTSNPTEVYVRGKNFSSSLKGIFKTLMDIATRVILSHYGNLSTITPTKLQVMAALCNEVQGVKYNWAAFLTKQWTEVAREVEATDAPKKYKIGSKLRFGTKISFVLKHLQPNLDDRFPSEVKKNPLFTTSVDVPASRVVLKPLSTKKAGEEDKKKGKEKMEDTEEEKERLKERMERSRRRSSVHTADLMTPAPKRSREEKSEAIKAEAEPPQGVTPASIPAPIPYEASLLSAIRVEQEAMAEVKHHFRGVELPEEMINKLCDFLTHTRLRGAECSKLMDVAKSVGEEIMQMHEAETLTVFKSTGFDEFINYTKVWDRMEEFVVSQIPDASDKLPERDASPAEILSSLHDIKIQLAEMQAESDRFEAIAREGEKEHNNLKAALVEKDEEIRGLRKRLLEKESLAPPTISQDL